ncbi:DUF7281 domain-containing protein [Marinobacter sp. MBR-105]|jgi:hypothetical protein
MSADEFGAIRRLLQSGRKTARRNQVWTRIHNETGAGVLDAREIHFTMDDLWRLREYGRQITGLDPQFDTTAGSRVELAQKTSNEKLAADSVFGDLLVMATAGNTELKVSGQPVRTPPGSVLSVHVNALDYDALAKQRLVMIENGGLMTHWQDIRLPEGWKDCILVYRGHRENVRHARRLVQAQPSDQLGLYYDFDPQGLYMALATGKGHAFVPAQWEAWSRDGPLPSGVNQRDAFRRQQGAMSRLRSRAATLMQPWIQVINAVDKGEWAIMQEHMAARGWELTTMPVPEHP